MHYRQFIWGLSNGVGALGVSGAFWFGLAAWPVSGPRFIFLTVLIGVGFAAFLWAAVRLRQKSQGFKLSELKHGPPGERREIRKILLEFRLVNFGHIILILLSIALCYYFRRQNLMWPFIALIVSLHYCPFAWLFKVRAYYVTGIAGSIVSLAAILGLGGSDRLVYLGSGMGMVFWLPAFYLVWYAEEIAQQTVAENK